jgi:hypothetical protein
MEFRYEECHVLAAEVKVEVFQECQHAFPEMNVPLAYNIV